MLEPQLPLEAYRQDRAQTDVSELTGVDAALVRIASLLQRCLQLRQAGAADEEIQRVRLAYIAMVATVLHEKGLEADAQDRLAQASAADVLAAIREIATVAEDGGALRLANALLMLAYRDIGHEAGVRELGRVILHRGRIARKMSDHDAAHALITIARDMAVEHDDDELRARADIGFGNIARERGNLQALKQHCLAALESATRAGVREVIAMAHHGLMIVAGTEKSHEEAVMHAWAVYGGVRGDSAMEAEALVNVAQATLDLGEPAVALHAFVAAFAQKLPKHFELPALGGMAIAAARVNERALLERVIVRTNALARGNDFKYEAVSTRSEIATALHILGDRRAAEWQRDALAAATAAGFYEIMYRMEHLDSPPVAVPRVAPSRALLDVLADVETASKWGELQAAF
jgi:hypothetical protein